MISRRPLARIALMLLVAAATLGCGDDDYGPYNSIGSGCRTAADCQPGAECQRGGDFPDGTCTLPCRSHLECPRYSACVDTGGGLCLISCSNDSFCREKYKCKDKNDEDGSGKSLVCIK
jgi:hypothetical protein